MSEEFSANFVSIGIFLQICIKNRKTLLEMILNGNGSVLHSSLDTQPLF
jgi:hypothetical protein